MTDPIWSDPPSVPLFQWLARGSLKQNLPQAVRLWVWLSLLYGAPPIRLQLPEPFCYADWRDAFFSLSHPSDDVKPNLHDRTCPCAKTTAAWLFAPSLNWTQAQWDAYCAEPAHWQQVQQKTEQLKQELAQHNALPKDFESFLHQTRLFGMTRRTLASDLKKLAQIHWLKQDGQRYSRVSTWPTRPLAALSDGEVSHLAVYTLEFLTQPDLAAIADNLSRVLNGHRRFFVHVDYVVPQEQQDRVDDWQDKLRELWQEDPIPPVKLHYWSASLLRTCTAVVYPVCIYHYRRGPYLCGFGEIPEQPMERLDWRNYRLDRIQAIARLDWDDPQVPRSLLNRQQRNQLPTPDEIELRMAQAWGFDYYQPVQRLLLRFDQEWDKRYIRNSLRHVTFEPIDYVQAGRLIKQELTGVQQKHLLRVWQARSKEDAYYQALYRQDDPNVKQRLRAWRPHVEVLLPWGLRQRFAEEVKQELRFYHDEFD